MLNIFLLLLGKVLLILLIIVTNIIKISKINW